MKFHRVANIILAICLCMSAHAQVKFITAGKIEFERRTNQHALMDESDEWHQMIKSKVPRFANNYFDLIFKDGHSLYKPGRQVQE